MTPLVEAVAAPARPCCRLCAAPGEYGAILPSVPYSGLCQDCVTAARPTRAGLEQAVVIVARQTLAEAEALALPLATPDELTYHVCVLKRSLCGMLQLFAVVKGNRR
ncbi:hypothetical protein [Streptomyces johnsoniae]|uniref:Uncharacterized protein n=1 Tax=Streptomyces johnsoniae TaxID=3075532 RepID=A0ABU2RZ35_9ACTN|nr:hypothetical protein [Streptomyces sp. DSM 41886]MDT0441454.1 hypothetical protein [Streptomyces sp. DSM 41886]